VTGVRTRYN